MLISVKLTVFFNEPFWIGIFEIQEGEYYKISKITFGAEPKDAEVFEFVLNNYYKLNFIEQEFEDKKFLLKRVNPKREQRLIKKQLENKGIGTKAQIALKKQHEANKIEGRKRSKEKKEAEERKQYEMKKDKRKEKHKGH
ncbi:YjdF family protein [Clostridium sp. ZBS15]|uniref:YjdF family protein n=1 Tax=Clostridium sp. ZBS15 TaxID=2949969 RepID=UPI00207954BA|nr:YjdF family protein [Clostridium sp. ZBS15]